MSRHDQNMLSLSTEGTSHLRQLLFRDSYRRESPAEIVQWWERRRIPFNIAVGATGLVSLTFINLLGAIGPLATHFRGPPLMAIVAYGVIANIAFTSGWMLEVLMRPLFGTRTGTVGATLFRYGLAFAVGLTALPTVFAFAEFGFRVVRWLA